MPGANYFLSKLAAQTPGPLVCDGPPKPPPSSYFGIVPVPTIKHVDEEQEGIASCKQLAVVPPKDLSVPVVGNGFGWPFTKSFPFGPPTVSVITKGTFSCQLPITAKGLDENPVGELQELCTKMRWVFPTYSVCCENGQPHERTFVVVVRLYSIREKGEAKSKKGAKREAARLLLVQLLHRSGSGLGGQAYLSETCNRPADHQSGNPLPTSLRLYQPREPNVRCIDILQELGGRRNFRLIYLRLDSKTTSGLTQVMLQVCTCPLIVVRGEGHTILAAKADAALNALECLRVTSDNTSTQKISESA